MKQIFPLILFVCALVSCSQEELMSNPTEITGDETIHFAASLAEQVDTRAETVTLPDVEITVIGPGYGSNAPNQKIIYEVVNIDPNPENKPSTLEATDEESVMKRSAKVMNFTAWTEPGGVAIDDLGAGTVDFTGELENFIGAHVKEELPTTDMLELQFKHLVAKVTMKVYNIAEGNTPIAGKTAKVTFPAIKQFGTVTATLNNLPAVTAGNTGGSLEKVFGEESVEFYLPPLSTSDLLMYGSFSIMVGTTSYVGTLNNLTFENVTSEIEAGQHIIMTVHINDDHTALLQAVTLAPWTEYPTNLYNRPVPGIWGMEDLVLLSQVVNDKNEDIWDYWEEKSSFGNKYYFFDDNDEEGRPIIRLYTNISLEDAKEFLPIGTVDNPFEGITFDGNGYTISGLTLENNTEDNQGLFGVVRDAKLFNVKVSGSTISGKDNVGTLAGTITGTTIIDRCSATQGDLGTVSGKGNVGGLVGYVDNEANIYNSRVSLNTISGESAVGGLIGNNEGTVANSYVHLSRGIACSGSNGGGFAGSNSGAIENCYSLAYFIQRATNCGAWVGYNSGTNTRFYWNTTCIDNLYCSKIIGNNTAVNEDNMEVLPSGSTSGNKYLASNGWLRSVNDLNSVYLRTQLNLNVDTSSNKDNFLYWAVLNGSNLPVLSNNSFLLP